MVKRCSAAGLIAAVGGLVVVATAGAALPAGYIHQAITCADVPQAAEFPPDQGPLAEMFVIPPGGSCIEAARTDAPPEITLLKADGSVWSIRGQGPLDYTIRFHLSNGLVTYIVPLSIRPWTDRATVLGPKAQRVMIDMYPGASRGVARGSCATQTPVVDARAGQWLRLRPGATTTPVTAVQVRLPGARRTARLAPATTVRWRVPAGLPRRSTIVIGLSGVGQPVSFGNICLRVVR